VKVKIISDGTVRGTKIIDAETGEPVPNVVEVSFVHKAGDIPRAIIRTLMTELDAETGAEKITICPACKAEQLERIKLKVYDASTVDNPSEFRRKIT
jgi:hypothetical protein